MIEKYRFCEKRINFGIKKLFFSFIFLIIIFSLIIVYISIPPRDFPDRKIVKVKSGEYLSQVVENLEKENIIKSPLMLKVFVFTLSGHRQIKAGDYLFSEPQSSLRIAYRLINGVQELPKIKVTFFEGMTAKQMSVVLRKSIPNFDSNTFLVLAEPYEGYLFPDTYFFYENISPEDVVAQLRDTFKQKITTKLLAIRAYGKPLEDVIKMASIIEKEAANIEDKKIIAGILWKRISIGMPIQVDAPFYYISGKDSASLTTKDLTTDTPYNTYTNKGLTPTPISNPGLDAIEATVNPTETKYLFFLSDKKGVMHYALDHDGHVINKNKYLR